jgi:hypothetical protein
MIVADLLTGKRASRAHIRAMAYVTQTTELFKCPKCKVWHRAARVQLAEIRLGRFDCTEGGAEVHSWSGVYEYTGWKVVVMKPSIRGH